MSAADIQRCQKATDETYTSAEPTAFRPDIFECTREDGKKDYVNITQKWYVKDSTPIFDDQGALTFQGEIVGYGQFSLEPHVYLGPDGKPLKR